MSNKRLQVSLAPELIEALQNDQTLWTQTEIWRYERYNTPPSICDLVQRAVARDQRQRGSKSKTDRFNMVETNKR